MRNILHTSMMQMKIEHPIKSMESPVQFDVFYKLRSSVSWGHLFSCRPQLNFRLAAIRVNGVIKTVWAVRTSAVMRRSLFSWPPQTNVYLSITPCKDQSRLRELSTLHHKMWGQSISGCFLSFICIRQVRVREGKWTDSWDLPAGGREIWWSHTEC